ncbi:MAG: pyridoxal-dependent decarboxylase [Acidobacteriota bacterium]|nr:pyridoxal-dependent decarboxylase [Acidobacteriota bacterium]
MTTKPTPGQTGIGDMDAGEFREWAHRVADLAADYLEGLEQLPVVPNVKPGEIRAQLSDAPPVDPQPTEEIFADYKRLIEPNITHWQHPRFMAYFPSMASGPGILGEWLSATLNSNVMMWRNAPASTELEECVVAWLRQMLGLPGTFSGMFTDTASISTLLSLVAARHKVLDLETPTRLRLYASDQAHMSIEKAAMVIGVGPDGVRPIPADRNYRMDVDALARAIREDRDAGWQPFCVAGTLGTTASTSIDPARAIGELCRDEGLWCHFDAAYGGALALVPEYRDLLAGWELADSIVINPHKWFFTPFDASLLLFRDGDAFRNAFALNPEYLKTATDGQATNFNEYGIQLGRRFRALKLWIMIRYFGTEGFARRIRAHVEWAREFRDWIDAAQDWERLAPTPAATICFRYHPSGIDDPGTLDRLNVDILERINEEGRFYLSHARLDDRHTLRLTIGNLRQTRAHVAEAWQVLQATAARVTPRED